MDLTRSNLLYFLWEVYFLCFNNAWLYYELLYLGKYKYTHSNIIYAIISCQCRSTRVYWLVHRVTRTPHASQVYICWLYIRTILPTPRDERRRPHAHRISIPQQYMYLFAHYYTRRAILVNQQQRWLFWIQFNLSSERNQFTFAKWMPSSSVYIWKTIILVKW